MKFENYTNYNIFSLNNLNMKNADCEGIMAVGNNIQLANFSLGIELSPLPDRAELNSLIVGNKVNIKNCVNYSGNTVLQKNKYPFSYKMRNPNGKLVFKKVIDFDASYKLFNNISNTLKKLKQNTIVEHNEDDSVLNIEKVLSDQVQYVNLFFNDITTNVRSINFSIDESMPVFINIIGGDIKINKLKITINNKDVNKNNSENIFWNFVNVGIVEINNTKFFGNIFCVNSDLYIYNSIICGSVFAKNIYGNSDILKCKIGKKVVDILNNINYFVTQNDEIPIYYKRERNYGNSCSTKTITKTKSVSKTVSCTTQSKSVTTQTKSTTKSYTCTKTKPVIKDCSIAKPKHKKCNCECIESGLIDILKSIAIEEEAIANILNAEACKIHKSLEFVQSPEDFIKVDEAVSKTIREIGHIQSLLIYKLEDIIEIYYDKN